jgi:hypothetical protein
MGDLLLQERHQSSLQTMMAYLHRSVYFSRVRMLVQRSPLIFKPVTGSLMSAVAPMLLGGPFSTMREPLPVWLSEALNASRA